MTMSAPSSGQPVHFESGCSSALLAGTAAYSLPEPLFENRRGEFVVTLRHSMEPAEPSCDGAQTDLLSYCTVPRTRQEIAAFLGIKTASYAIRQYVLPLVETSKLKMTIPDRPGSPRQTYYKA